jgi:S1-C subfamily serine protease
MKRVPRYSSSRRQPPAAAPPASAAPNETPAPGETERPLAAASVALYRRNQRLVLFSGGGLVVLFALLLFGSRTPPQVFTQRDIDQAVLYTLQSMPREPSVESVAFEVIRPSVVWVRRADAEGDALEGSEPVEQGMGTGVVIVDDGTILTNLHVVAGASRLGVVFADGTESPADLIDVQPEQDLAVIRARLLPDDLMPATLASTRNLRMGDRVIAVGFPFGIGPSLSAGVISGLRRNYRTPEGERLLTDLIQFDAAVNPGNSGGPLVNADGHVVGIVTALLNPSQRVFIGIGFAVPIETAAASAGMSPF